MDAEYLRALDWAANELSVPSRSDSESPEETNHRLRRIARRRKNKRVVRFLRSEFSSYLDRLHP
jgi:hypothetical protein